MARQDSDVWLLLSVRPGQQVSIRTDDGYETKRAYINKRGELEWEWLTTRGWRKTRGGGRGWIRKPSDILVLRVAS